MRTLKALVVVQGVRVQERSAERAAAGPARLAGVVSRRREMPMVHLVEPVVVLVPVPPPLHHRAVGVEISRALRLHLRSLFDGALADSARGGDQSPRAARFRPARARLLGVCLATRIRPSRLLGGFRPATPFIARTTVLQQQVLNRRRVVARISTLSWPSVSSLP